MWSKKFFQGQASGSHFPHFASLSLATQSLYFQVTMWSLTRVMMMRPLNTCSKPCSTGTHNQTMKKLTLFVDHQWVNSLCSLSKLGFPGKQLKSTQTIQQPCLINKYGGCHSPCLNNLSKEIWFWCIARNIHITAAHVPGIDNISADALSRKFIDNIEWSLDEKTFTSLCFIFDQPTVDPFLGSLSIIIIIIIIIITINLF